MLYRFSEDANGKCLYGQIRFFGFFKEVDLGTLRYFKNKWETLKNPSDECQVRDRYQTLFIET